MKRFLVSCCALILSAQALAENSPPDDFSTRLSAFLGPNFPVSAIAESPIPGIYEISAGNRILYASINQNHVMIGNMFDTLRGVNVGEEKQNLITRKLAKDEVSKIPTEQMVVFKGEQSKRHITVFTDMDCGYCRKLHDEVPALNAAGIEVRYLMFPALTPTSMPKAVSVWCSDDQQSALTLAKTGAPVPEESCENPVTDQYAIGKKIGVRGTPYMILDDYQVIPGYVPAKDLIARLGLN